MQSKLFVVVVGAAVGLGLAVTVPVAAHHAFAAEFDANQPVTLRGAITKVEWTNPHIWIFLDAKQKDGKVVNWAVEGGAPNALYRRGFNKNSLATGTRSRDGRVSGERRVEQNQRPDDGFRRWKNAISGFLRVLGRRRTERTRRSPSGSRSGSRIGSISPG